MSKIKKEHNGSNENSGNQSIISARQDNKAQIDAANFDKLAEIVTTLRSEEGCPWDRKQTPSSLKKYLLAETQELAEAIDNNDVANIREELGDVFFILTLLTKMHEEQGHFSGDDVFADICRKMVRRHPHVYGDATACTEEELRRQWEAIKALEKDEARINAGTT